MPALPKDPSIRQRRNKRSTRAIISADARIARAPKLPAHPQKRAWHPLAKAFWADVWRSPMATQYVDADTHGLFRMLVLTDEFFRKPSVAVSGELRMLSQNYGLSPIDRRRLEWTIAKTEDALAGTERRVRKARTIDHDPREVLDQ